MTPSPVLLVGTGPMAVAHHAVLRSLGAEVVVVGRSPAGCARFEAETGTPARPGGIEALAGGPPLAPHAVVAVPVPALATATAAVLDSGVGRVLVEKPGALDGAELRALADRAATRGADVRIAYNRRFYASTLAARALVAEDGGAHVVSFDFTEWSHRVEASGHPPAVLDRWFLANSTHVVDLALHLAGEPVELTGHVRGALAWHPRGARFTGTGVTDEGALLSWASDWASAGRWGVEVTTARRRLVLRPLEQLFQQDIGSVEVHPVPLDDSRDVAYKPGLHRQAEVFLADGGTGLPTVAEQAARVAGCYEVILGGGRWDAASGLAGRAEHP